MTEIFNKRELKERRQMLRRNMTEAEKILWSELRKKQLDGLRFRRQYSVDASILDFYCPEVRLDVEVDGNSHDRPEAQKRDHARDEMLRGLGITVLRITNDQVKNNLKDVLQRIKDVAGSLRSTDRMQSKED
jgi:very-short-patch-repair endonuclease